MSEPGAWRRLYPLSPIVRGGRGTIGIAILLLPALLRGGISPGDLVPLGVIALITILGFVSWFVTRWTIDGDDLRIETGVLRRRSLRFPLSQVQAIDVLRPGLGRLLGAAELRLRMGGSAGGAARLSYVAAGEVEALRAQLLALAHGAPPDQATPAVVVADEHVLTTVPTARLVASILISDVGFYAEAVLAALVVTALLAPAVASAVISGGGLVWLLGVITVTWRRFNLEYRLTVADAPDGLRLSGGLVSLTSETIRPGRVQAVRMVEPLLWRPFGWCRLQVDLAGGRQPSDGTAPRSGASSGSCCRSVAGRWSSRCSTGSFPIARSASRRRPVASGSRARSATACWPGAARIPAWSPPAVACGAPPAGCHWRRCRACGASRGRCSGG